MAATRDNKKAAEVAGRLERADITAQEVVTVRRKSQNLHLYFTTQN
jgi:hypothetical protein